MEFFLPVVVLSGLALWVGAGAVYWVLVALSNVLYRATRGQWFRWGSRWTMVPFFLLAIVCFGVAWAGWASYPGPK